MFSKKKKNEQTKRRRGSKKNKYKTLETKSNI